MYAGSIEHTSDGFQCPAISTDNLPQIFFRYRQCDNNDGFASYFVNHHPVRIINERLCDVFNQIFEHFGILVMKRVLSTFTDAPVRDDIPTVLPGSRDIPVPTPERRFAPGAKGYSPGSGVVSVSSVPASEGGFGASTSSTGSSESSASGKGFPSFS